MGKWRKTKLSLGLCGTCGNEPHIPGKKDCEVCRERRARRQKERYHQCKNNGNEYKARKREEFKAAGLCANCGKIPHAKNKLTCAECLNKQKLFLSKLKDETYSRYGGYKCNCCGESTKEFLTLDHINNDGANHRRKMNAGKSSRSVGFSRSLYLWLKRNDYPNTFQVLCMNCNWGKKVNGGICPHKDKL